MKLLLSILIAATFGLSSLPRSAREHALKPATDSWSASSAHIEDILQAHGGRDALKAIYSYRVEMTKIVSTVPPRFYAQKVRLSVEGDKIKRETSDPRGDRTRLEMIDEGGHFHSVAITRNELGGASSTPLYADAQRQSVVRANVAVSSLIPFLKTLSDPGARASYLGREQGAMDKYLVASGDREFNVYLDQNRLISRVERGANTFQFADFKQVGLLRLPFVERVYVGNQQVFEFFISELEINPTFQSDHFSRAGAEK